MSLSRDERTALNESIDECLSAACDDVRLAAELLAVDLERQAGGGLPYAISTLHRATVTGLSAVIRRRIAGERIAVGDREMPARYATSNGTEEWLHTDVEQLDSVSVRLNNRAASHAEHAEVIDQARDLARKHNVTSAAEAFELEGITVTELAS